MRLGIILRLIAVVALVAVIGVEGGAVKDQAFQGKAEHYTVVLADNANPNDVAATHSKQGVKVEHIVSNSTSKGYEGLMTPKEASKVEADPMVDYIEMDSQKVVHHTWWDTTLITLGLRTPHLS